MLECDICGRGYELSEHIRLCECGEPLRLQYLEGSPREDGNIWQRYSSFFPYKGEHIISYSLGEGGTPLSKARKLSDKLDIDLYLKNETTNPTWSFKDRGSVLSTVRADELGAEKIGTVSTGNMAASVSAYGIRNDVSTVSLVSSKISESKMSQISP